MQQDDQHRHHLPADDALQESIKGLVRSLTVIVACTQLLRREMQGHGDGTSEMAETRLAMIEAAATDMTTTLRELQDVYSPERD